VVLGNIQGLAARTDNGTETIPDLVPAKANTTTTTGVSTSPAPTSTPTTTSAGNKSGAERVAGVANVVGVLIPGVVAGVLALNNKKCMFK
ncbi:hypothetical protein HDU76_004769, partial [Blyttiomyces sp. JEL0837]